MNLRFAKKLHNEDQVELKKDKSILKVLYTQIVGSILILHCADKNDNYIIVNHRQVN